MTDKNEKSPNDYANYFRYKIGVNVIPANSKNKKPLVGWKSDVRGNWQEIPIPEEIHQQWIRENKFKDGLAVICGKVFHNKEHSGKWLNGIDCDNMLGLDEMCPEGIDRIAQITVVEQHANKEKCHIYFYTEEPINSQAPLSGENIPKIEIKSGGKFLLYCAGGVHKDGSRIEILNKKQVKTLDKESLETRIDGIFTKHGLTYLSKEKTLVAKPLYQRDSTVKLHEGDNRGQYILSYLVSKKIKNPELDEEDLTHLARKYEQENCADIYDNDKIKDLVRQAMGYGEQHTLQENTTINSNDKAQIKKFIRHLIKKYDIITPFNTNEIYFRDGVIHKLGLDGILKQELKGMIIKTRDFNDLKFNIGIESQIPMNELNPFNNDWIGLTNVILDPVTFEPIETVAYVNSVLNRKYRPELQDKEDVILNAVKEILGDNYVKFLAICVVLLVGKNNVKKMIIFDGSPDSGKTTLLIILANFVVDFTSNHIKKIQHDTRLLAKCNSILNISDEAEDCIQDEDVFKNTIDGSIQQESWKYDKELTKYDPNKVLHIGASNGIPDIRGNKGIAKRLEVIPCKNHFEKNDGWQNNLVGDDNLDRFLLTVIEYAKLNEKNPLLDMSTDQKTELFEILGDPVGYFKENLMYQEDSAYCLPDDVWEKFMSFKKEKGISKEYTPRKFAIALNIGGSKPKRIDGKSVKVYMNWGLVGKSNTNQTITNV